MGVDELEKRVRAASFDNNIPISGGKITDVQKFIDSHITTLRANSGKRLFMPYYKRLVSLLDYEKGKQQTDGGK